MLWGGVVTFCASDDNEEEEMKGGEEEEEALEKNGCAAFFVLASEAASSFFLHLLVHLHGPAAAGVVLQALHKPTMTRRGPLARCTNLAQNT